MSLCVGDEFSSYEAFSQAKDNFERTNYVELCKEKSEMYQTSDADLKQQLRYRRITFGCKYGVKRKASVSKGIRQVNSFKQGCPFKLILQAKDGRLRVTEVRGEHSDHPRDATNFLHLPKRRRLDPNLKAEITAALHSKSNKKMLQDYIMQKTGQVVLMKDLHNLTASKNNNNNNGNSCDTDLITVIDQMKDVEDAVIQVAVTDGSELIGVFFQDRRMKVLFRSFPQLVIYDASYRLNSYTLPILLLLVVDGNGESEVCCLWISTSRARQSLDSFIGIFKEHNQHWDQIQVLLGEKDYEERKTFKEHFPKVHLDLCLFHVLKTFSKDVKRMRITESQREHALDLINKLASASTEVKYHRLYVELCQADVPKAVVEYFNENWHHCRDEWSSYSRCGSRLNQQIIMSRGQERFECVNHRMKSALGRTRFGDLKQFFSQLMSVTQSMALEKDHKAVSMFQKVPVVIGDEDSDVLNEFRELLTPFAYDKLKCEVVKMKDVKFVIVNSDFTATLEQDDIRLTVTANSCSCEFGNSMKLPCCHVLALRQQLGKPVFDADHCDQRWTRSYHRAVRSEIERKEGQVSNIVSKMDRLNQVSRLTSKLASLIPELPPEQFEFYLGKLKTFSECVESKKLFTIVTSGCVAVNQNLGAEKKISSVSTCDNQQIIII